MREEISITDIFRMLGDDKTVSILEILSNESRYSYEIIATLALSKRQFYDRISELTWAGLIDRHKGKYSMTSYGRIISHLLEVVEKVVRKQLKLQAVDMLTYSAISKDDHDKIIDALIDDHEVKALFFKDLEGAGKGTTSLAAQMTASEK